MKVFMNCPLLERDSALAAPQLPLKIQIIHNSLLAGLLLKRREIYLTKIGVSIACEDSRHHLTSCHLEWKLGMAAGDR